MTQTFPENLDNLTEKQIENLLNLLEENLKTIELDKPINEIVYDNFQSKWELIENVLQEQYEEDLKKSEEHMLVSTAIDLVLTEHINEDFTKLFWEVAERCVEENNFRYIHKALNKLKTPYEIYLAKLAFNIVRYKSSLLKEKEFKKIIEKQIYEVPKLKEIVNIFHNFNLI